MPQIYFSKCDAMLPTQVTWNKCKHIGISSCRNRCKTISTGEDFVINSLSYHSMERECSLSLTITICYIICPPCYYVHFYTLLTIHCKQHYPCKRVNDSLKLAPNQSDLHFLRRKQHHNMYVYNNDWERKHFTLSHLFQTLSIFFMTILANIMSVNYMQINSLIYALVDENFFFRTNEGYFMSMYWHREDISGVEICRVREKIILELKSVEWERRCFWSWNNWSYLRVDRELDPVCYFNKQSKMDTAKEQLLKALDCM